MTRRPPKHVATTGRAYEALHRAPAPIGGKLQTVGALAAVAVTGSAFAIGGLGPSVHVNWSSASAAVPSHASSTAQTNPSADKHSSDDVKRVLWYVDGKLVATQNRAQFVQGLSSAPLSVQELLGSHRLTVKIELFDGHILTVNAPVASSTPSTAQTRTSTSASVPSTTRPATAPTPLPTTKPIAVAPTPTQSATPKPTVTATAAPKPSPSTTPTASPSRTASPSPSAPPSTASSNTPTATSGSFNPVNYNWSSVGDPTAPFTGDKTLSTNGATLSNCDIGNARITASAVTVGQCTIKGGVNGPGAYTLDHNFITSDGDGIDPTGPGQKLIEYNKIWRDGTRVGTKHEDGIQFWQGGNTIVRGNWISGWMTSAMMVKADLGPISNVTIDSNYLNNPTGYFQLYLCPASHGLSNITVTNNAFGKAKFTASTCGSKLTFVHTQAQRQAAIAAGNKAASKWVVWDNNHIAGTNTVVAPPGGWAQ